MPEPRVYYGEGSATMAFSNIHGMKELDYPTDQDRAEIFLPESEKTGVRIDSLLKRIVFGWRSGKFWELVFSDLIKPNTRVHYIRMPVDRLARVAPFLFYDSNPYAVAVDGRIVWMVNAHDDDGSLSVQPHRGAGGQVRRALALPAADALGQLHRGLGQGDRGCGDRRGHASTRSRTTRSSRAWQKIYPGLFTPADQMPEAVRRQLTYPPQLLHIQFDDLYIYYHMKDPMYFFNMEDMWDDADEVLGPILDTGKAITFSIEPFAVHARHGQRAASGRERRRVQYSLAMAFTPEKALNLRGIPIVYQDPPDYGKLACCRSPRASTSSARSRPTPRSTRIPSSRRTSRGGTGGAPR